MTALDLTTPTTSPSRAPAPPLLRHTRPRDLIALSRPYQWAKNLLVVPAPLLHSAAWTGTGLTSLAHALLVFTVASVLVYVGNDIADRHRDTHHPVKRHRPLAAGRLPVAAAVVYGVLLAVVLTVCLVLLAPALAWPVGAYLALNAAYSCGVKNVPVLEVFVVAAGFNLRVLAGYLAVGLAPPGWLLACVFPLCLLLVLGKRRRELDQAGPRHRSALRGYTVTFLDQAIVLSAGLAAVTFLIFLSQDLGRDFHLAAVFLIPLVLLGLFRYLWAVTVKGGGADPVRMLLRDRFLAIDALLCAVVLAWTKIAAASSLPGLLHFLPGARS
ncbi:UbiA prenyltransferase family protein [Streptomyces sp. ACA25]|uniref:UbiA prenyltransferase family protein n=1 Tax=Streptomyces sp. ACA25 TaxID=3022596 RepID=UPI0023076B6F|nr:UbiA prenyltransferase family protein [Streptomyces sp. ACA25]MDB1087435.1 UbiA prenyltransferase family protein [Streptomyces sp. ACA25]